MKSKIVLFLTIITCFLLQSTVLHKISIGSITPNLLLILCVSMGLMRGRKSGMWTGFFSGLLIGSVFWICYRLLCPCLYVCGLSQRLCLQDLL